MRLFIRLKGSETMPRAGVHKCTACGRAFVRHEDVAMFRSVADARCAIDDRVVLVKVLDGDDYDAMPRASNEVEVIALVCSACLRACDFGGTKEVPLTLSAGKVQ